MICRLNFRGGGKSNGLVFVFGTGGRALDKVVGCPREILGGFTKFRGIGTEAFVLEKGLSVIESKKSSK